MRGVFYSVMILIIFTACGGSRNTRPDSSDADIVFLKQCILEMDELVSKNRQALGKVARVYDIARMAIHEERITLQVMDSAMIPKGYLEGGAVFSVMVNAKDKGSIIFNRRILRKYHKHRSIIFSILIHEMHHAHDYLLNRRHFLHYSNRKSHYEHLLYEADAYISEGIFINACLKKGSYQLTDFEKFLAGCIEKKRVSLATMYLGSFNYDVIMDLYSLMRRPGSYEKTIKEYIIMFDKIGEMVRRMKKSDCKKHEKYQAAIIIGTCVFYGPSLFFDVVNKKNYTGGPMRYITLKYHPGFHAAHERLRVLYNSIRHWVREDDKFRNRLISFMKNS